jgi:hypothetical protein
MGLKGRRVLEWSDCLRSLVNTDTRLEEEKRIDCIWCRGRIRVIGYERVERVGGKVYIGGFVDIVGDGGVEIWVT